MELSVDGVSPPDGAFDVPVNALVVVRLSEPVSAVSVENDALVVSTDGGPVAGTVPLDSSRTTLTWTSDEFLPTNTAFTVDVDSFTDLAGHPVEPFTSSFSVEVENLSLAAGVTATVSSFFPGFGPDAGD